MSEITRLVNVQGRVQGVGFRYFTTHQAKKIGVTGYAKNMDDGSVEVMVTGTPERVQQLLDWLKKGPPSSKVTGVDIKEATLKPFQEFKIDY